MDDPPPHRTLGRERRQRRLGVAPQTPREPREVDRARDPKRLIRRRARVQHRGEANEARGDVRDDPQGAAERVITSYSIHYTKLYESGNDSGAERLFLV